MRCMLLESLNASGMISVMFKLLAYRARHLVRSVGPSHVVVFHPVDGKSSSSRPFETV